MGRLGAEHSSSGHRLSKGPEAASCQLAGGKRMTMRGTGGEARELVRSQAPQAPRRARASLREKPLALEVF